jgi:hypothetical protein
LSLEKVDVERLQVWLRLHRDDKITAALKPLTKVKLPALKGGACGAVAGRTRRRRQSQFLRLAEVPFVAGHASALPAYKFWTIHHLFVVFEGNPQIPDIFEQTQMLFVTPMGHLHFSHGIFLLLSWS